MIILESVDGVPIRFPDERIEHIQEHLYLNIETVIDALEHPDFVIRGRKSSKIAVLNLGRRRWLNVIYKELPMGNDGFIITAFISSDVNLEQILWER